MNLKKFITINIVFRHGGLMLSKKFHKVMLGIVTGIVFNGFVLCNVDASADVTKTSIEEFVAKTYEIFLSREINEDTGVEYWGYMIRNHEKSLYDYIISLLSGEEFSSRDITNEEFIDMLYTLILQRVPIEEERNFWLGRLNEKESQINDIKKSRVEIAKDILNDQHFKEFCEQLKVTFKSEDLNKFGVEELKNDYPQDKIEFIDNLYKKSQESSDSFHKNGSKFNNEQEILDYIMKNLPIFNSDGNNVEYEELKSVSGENVKRLVYALDYEIEFPHDRDKAVYISPFIQISKKGELSLLSIGLGITSRGLGREITGAEIVLGDQVLKLNLAYTNDSKYESKGISLNEVEFELNSTENLKTLESMLNSELTKLRITFDGDKTYLYSLYPKDRVRNTTRFVLNLYTQMISSYLIESRYVFESTVFNSYNK